MLVMTLTACEQKVHNTDILIPPAFVSLSKGQFRAILKLKTSDVLVYVHYQGNDVLFLSYLIKNIRNS